MKVDSLTRRWIRNESDEKAAHNGCKFDEKRGMFVVDWVAENCVLYEGEQAGEPLVYEDDWQFEVSMRLFGWVKKSDRWGRWIRRFRQASIWIPKKNKKSPTLASWATYLLCGDGEPGQKVFLAAKDGKQSREIAGKHCVEMMQRSESLSSVCTLNKTTMQITHDPTSSVLIPLSSSNKRHQEGKEGINGCVLVDETHVVDREFMSRIKRAGISRSEPLHIEVSTAGKDPDCYGKDRFDYGRLVANGTEENEYLLFQEYSAPQKLKEDDLDKDPVKWGKLANPAWGHTVGEEEFLADYKESKTRRSDLLDFMTYRLNIWQHSSSPWLKKEEWDKGEREFCLSDFLGRECWAAIDLASVRDFCSLTLAFPEPEDQYAMFWWYWLPEDTARKYSSKTRIDDWLVDPLCNLKLTDGARTNYGAIQAEFAELAERFEIQQLAYDDWNAEQFTQETHEGKTDNKGNVIIPGTGVPRFNFSQGLSTMNEPTKRFEAAVIDGRILHNGDPLTAWQIQNAHIKPDSNENYKPMKPGPDSIKKIDGVITAVMARAVAERGRDESRSVYEERGLLEI